MTHARSTTLAFAAGVVIALATTALAQVRASVDTNGVLYGYIVQKDGQTICENPSV